MSDLTLTRVPFTEEADSRMRMLKGRTGVTPNLICRLGYCMSLEEAGIPRLIPNTSVFKREINRYTLLGEFDSLFVSLLKVWINKYGLEQNNIDDYMVAHMHRGIDLVYARMKSIADLSILIPKSNVGEKDNEATDIS